MAQQLEATADAPPARGLPVARASAIAARLREFGPGRILALGTVLIALVALAGFAAMQFLAPRYTLLFGGLPPADVARIAERLAAMKVPYEIPPSGDAVLVPEDQVSRVRMALAQEGMPMGQVVGWELFDRTSPFTTTDFLADVQVRRALEGELARTIAALDAVRSARVHVVRPPRRLFAREQEPPSAAVMLELAAGRALDRQQVKAIRELVAAAVPGLEPGRVTVTDDRGRLLARMEDDAGVAMLDETEDYRRALEARLQEKIVALLERTLGPGRVAAQVTAELDFAERTTTEEIYDPEARAVRSSRTVEETTDRRESGGEGAVTASANLPGSPPAGAGSQASERTGRTEETVNYEVSRTVRSARARTPQLRRLSVAVQVDGHWQDDGSGNRTFEPLSKEEIAQLEALVRSAVGIDEERGDRLEIVSRPFVAAQAAVAEPDPIATLVADHGPLAMRLLWALVALAAVLFGLRPLLRRLLPPPEGAVLESEGTRVVVGSDGRPLLVHVPSGITVTVDAAGRPVLVRPEGPQPLPAPGEAGTPQPEEAAPPAKEDEPEREDVHELVSLANVEGKVKAKLMSDVLRIVEEYPQETVRVLREWLHEKER